MSIIIAEIGVNHNGSIELAKKMIEIASDAKVDFVKFQLGIPELIISRYAKKAEYQVKTTGSGTQLEMVQKLQLSFADHILLKEHCDKVGVQYLCTPFDIPTIDFLNSLDMPFWKIPSGEITNYPYLLRIAKTQKPVVLSTGMSNIGEIHETINLLTNNGCDKEQVTLLHCNTEYPTPMEDVNLRAMRNMGEHFGLKYGYSDHTPGIEVPIAAVALGARIIEKHFTLDRNMEGPDHRASLEPQELKNMVNSIRNIEIALGSDKKVVSPSEFKNKDIARKSIVANTNIMKGEILTEDNLTTKRPGDGLSPMLWEKVVGTVAKQDYQIDEQIVL